MKKIYVILDTNIIISALIRKDSNPGKVVKMALSGKIIPVMHKKIQAEYWEVCKRKKFNFPDDIISRLMSRLGNRAIFLDETKSADKITDEKDIVFYEVTLTAKDKFNDAYLVTGNGKHFPIKPFVVTPAEMIEIIEESGEGK